MRDRTHIGVDRCKRGALEYHGSVRQFGRYELIGEIGGGGMADVKLALQRGSSGIEKLVVLKLVHEELANDKAIVDLQPGATTYLHAQPQPGLTIGIVTLSQVLESQGRADTANLHKIDSECKTA